MTRSPLTPEIKAELAQIMTDCGRTVIAVSERFLELLDEFPEPGTAAEEDVLMSIEKAATIAAQRPARIAGKLGRSPLEQYRFACAVLELADVVVKTYVRDRTGRDWDLRLSWEPRLVPRQWDDAAMSSSLETVIRLRCAELADIPAA